MAAIPQTIAAAAADQGESKFSDLEVYSLELYIIEAFRSGKHALTDDNYLKDLHDQESKRRTAEGIPVISGDCPLHVWLLQAAQADPKIKVKQVQVENWVYAIVHYEDNICWRDEATALRMIARGLIIAQCISEDGEIVDGHIIYTMPKFFEAGQVSPEKLQLLTDGDATPVTVGKKYDGAGVTFWIEPATRRLRVNTHGSLLPNKVTEDAMKFIGKGADAIRRVMDEKNINSLLAEFCNQVLGHEIDNPTGIVVFGGFYNNGSKISRKELASIVEGIPCLSTVDCTEMSYGDFKSKMNFGMLSPRPLTSITEGFVADFDFGIPFKFKYRDWVLKSDIPKPNKGDKSKESYVSRVIRKFSKKEDHAFVTQIAGQMWDHEKSLLAAAEQEKEDQAHLVISEVTAALGFAPKPTHFREKIRSGVHIGKFVGAVLGKFKKYL